MILKQ